MAEKRRQDDRRSADEEQEEDGARGGREEQKREVRRSDDQAGVVEQGLVERQHPDVTGSSGGTETMGNCLRREDDGGTPGEEEEEDREERLPRVKNDSGSDSPIPEAEQVLAIRLDPGVQGGRTGIACVLQHQEMHVHVNVSGSGNIIVGSATECTFKAPKECHPAETLQRAADLCEEALKSAYKTTGSFIQLTPLVGNDKRHIMDFYTKLLLTQEESNPHWSQRQKPGDIELTSYKEVLKLKTKDGEAVKLTVFDGLPGRGKSTLFAKIAHEWAIGSVPAMQGYKLVVLLRMNELTENSDLVDAMFAQLLAEDVGIEKGELRSYMQKIPEKVLILLDGFDELITTDLCQSSFGSILKILNRKLLRGCCTFVSTRPSHYGKLVSEQLVQEPFTHVKVMGFSDKEVREYVHRFYYEEHDQAEALLAKIRSTNIPSELTESPMLLLLMCILWRKDSKLPDTVFRLYSRAVKYIFRRKQKEGEVPEEGVDTCVQEIGKVGLKGLLSPEQMLSFKEKDFERNDIRQATKAGILTSEKVLKELDTHNSVQFIHKTFQEYCSGKYLQHLQKANTQEFDKNLDRIMSQDPTKFGFLLRFCCGDSEACTRTILQLFRERCPRKELSANYAVGNLALECYVEGQSEKVLDEEFVRLVIPTHLTLSEPSALTRFLKCVCDQTKRHGSDCLANVTEITVMWRFLGQLKQLFSDLVEYTNEMTNLESLTLYCTNYPAEYLNVPVSPMPEDMPIGGVQKLKNHRRLVFIGWYKDVPGLHEKYIAEALGSLPGFAELGFKSVNFSGSASWSIFLKEWKSLQKLWFRSCSLTGQDMKCITESLVNLPDFVELDVSGASNVLQGSLKLWFENLKQCTNLKKLTLADRSLSEKDVMHWTEAVSSLPNLEELDLHRNILHGSVALWSPRLQSLQQLRKIDLSYCELTGEDVKHIAEAMRSLPNLKALNLDECGLTEPEVQNIAKSLGDLPKLSKVDLSRNKFLGGSSSSWFIHLKHVKHLNLAGCFIEEANLKIFAQTLSHLTMLIELNLSDNGKLGGSGEVWCKHFKHFKNLQKLDLSACSLTGEDMKHIVQSLGSVPSLVELGLSRNRLSGSGALWGEQLQLLKSLQKLKLSGCFLNCEDMKHIVQSLGSVPGLVELDLSRNCLSVSRALLREKLLAQRSLLLKSLQKLNLSDCKLQGVDMNHILQLSCLPNLAEVDFSWNELHGSVASWSNHLQQLTKLQKLHFGHCNLTESDKKVIRDPFIRQMKGSVVTFR